MNSTERSTRYQGVQKDSAGYKLLKGMGWKEGEGLGAAKQGIKEHIRVKKKFENWGVGAVESHDRARDWSNGMSEFHRVLSTLSEITSKHATGSSDTDNGVSDTSIISDEESQKKKSRKKKEKKKSKKRLKEGSDQDFKEKDAKKRAKKSIDDSKVAKEKQNTCHNNIEPAPGRKATHIGRFKKRETSKMVKGYSSSDLAAILGEDPFAKQNIEALHATIETRQSMLSSSDDEDADKSNPATPIIDAWWSTYFVVGPRAGSKGEKKRIKKKSTGFSEKDQENLYSSAHDNATTGRVGLGRSSMPKKVAGVRWAGTKTRLDSSSESDVEENSSEVEDLEEEQVEIQIVMPSSKSKLPDLEAVIQKALFREKNKSMKLKSLIKHVLSSVEISGGKQHVSSYIEANTHLYKISKDGKRKLISLVTSTT